LSQFYFGLLLGLVLLSFSLLFGSRFSRHGHPNPGPAWAQGRAGALGCVLACLGLSLVGIMPLIGAGDELPAWAAGVMLVGNLLTLLGLIVLGYSTVTGLEALRQPAPPGEPRSLRRVVAILPPALGGVFFVLYVLFGVR